MQHMTAGRLYELAKLPVVVEEPEWKNHIRGCVECSRQFVQFVKEHAEARAAFKVGDRVERIGTLVPLWMHDGIVTDVIPNKDGIDWATEYEVDFGIVKANFYQTQLRLVQPADPN